jgi:hypothetical protein
MAWNTSVLLGCATNLSRLAALQVTAVVSLLLPLSRGSSCLKSPFGNAFVSHWYVDLHTLPAVAVTETLTVAVSPGVSPRLVSTTRPGPTWMLPGWPLRDAEVSVNFEGGRIIAELIGVPESDVSVNTTLKAVDESFATDPGVTTAV